MFKWVLPVRGLPGHVRAGKLCPISRVIQQRRVSTPGTPPTNMNTCSTVLGSSLQQWHCPLPASCFLLVVGTASPHTSTCRLQIGCAV